MSSPKLHLPILKGFLLGEAMSCHNGVRCYPAIKRGTDEKYILKIISIPDCPDRLDALLLTGAVSNKKAALAYFSDIAKDTLDQVEILRELSHQEGFVPYLDGQIDAMENENGYDVYLLGTYKRSLERMLRNEAMTHADVIHMGLDLCAALAACRRAGYLYADLKPGNIFFDLEQGFRIGDVGFISLQSLKYASLPDKYRSSYTAPELSDMFATLNTTVDIYALGLVLYQAYNGGVLPFDGAAPAQELPTPLYADYEMASIILKACHPDPKQRWQQPTQMAQALIGYMTEFGASEAPIIPPVLTVEAQEEVEEVEDFLPEADAEQLQREMDDLVNAQPEELAFLDGLVSDETAPNDENAAGVSEDVITEEISQILAQADELIAHELPEPPVAPGPIEVPMPEPIVLEPEETEEPARAEDAPEAEEPEISEEEEPAAQPQPMPAEPEESAETAAVVTTPAQEEECERPAHRFPWRILGIAAIIVLLLGLFGLGKHYYDNHYLLRVDDLILTGEDQSIKVQIVSGIDDSLIRVICTDSYGNTTHSDVVDGIATFTDLNPSTRYTVRLEAIGTHKLTGSITDSFTTAGQTQILSFTAGIGPEDCSVVLNFTHNGTDAKNWTVSYSADGIAPQTQTFSDRSVVIYDLEPGAMYTFTLSSADGLFVGGQTQTSFLATNILCAKDLTITACGDGMLQVQWQQPDNGKVTQWQVRCFNASGYSETVTTDLHDWTFTGLDLSTGYTVEVTAVGMNRSVSTSVSANPITITGFTCQLMEDRALTLTWNFSGQENVSGWVLRYSIDGEAEKVLTLEENKAAILAVYGGNYQFILEAADGTTVFGGSFEHSISELEMFANFGVTAKEITVATFLLPEGEDWTVADIPAENFRPLFQSGEKAALLLTLPTNLEIVDATVEILFVVHSADGAHIQTDSQLLAWNLLWQNGPYALILPYMPETAGNYILSLYFDGCLVTQLDFIIG